ncbi:MAG: hypothetical protein WB510_04275 [Candidatus Sulfotelmatobacter sp.]
MLIASDAESYGQGKKKKKAAEAEKVSPQQDHCNRGHQVYRSRGGQHLMFGKPGSDFRHQDQVPKDNPGMRQNNQGCI